jgi:hypothetical protein
VSPPLSAAARAASHTEREGLETLRVQQTLARASGPVAPDPSLPPGCFFGVTLAGGPGGGAGRRQGAAPAPRRAGRRPPAGGGGPRRAGPAPRRPQDQHRLYPYPAPLGRPRPRRSPYPPGRPRPPGTCRASRCTLFGGPPRPPARPAAAFPANPHLLAACEAEGAPGRAPQGPGGATGGVQASVAPATYWAARVARGAPHALAAEAANPGAGGGRRNDFVPRRTRPPVYPLSPTLLTRTRHAAPGAARARQRPRHWDRRIASPPRSARANLFGGPGGPSKGLGFPTRPSRLPGAGLTARDRGVRGRHAGRGAEAICLVGPC